MATGGDDNFSRFWQLLGIILHKMKKSGLPTRRCMVITIRVKVSQHIYLHRKQFEYLKKNFASASDFFNLNMCTWKAHGLREVTFNLSVL